MPPTSGKWTDDSRTPHLGARFQNTRTMMARLAHLSGEDKGRWIEDALDFRGCTALDTSAWRKASPALDEDTPPARVKKEEDDAALGVAASSSSSSSKATSSTVTQAEHKKGANTKGGEGNGFGGSSGKSASSSSTNASPSKKKIKREAVVDDDDEDDEAPKATRSNPKRSASRKASSSASPSIVKRGNVATSSKATTPHGRPRQPLGGIPWGHDEDGGRRPGRIGDDIGFGFGDKEEEKQQRPATRRRLA